MIPDQSPPGCLIWSEISVSSFSRRTEAPPRHHGGFLLSFPSFIRLILALNVGISAPVPPAADKSAFSSHVWSGWRISAVKRAFKCLSVGSIIRSNVQRCDSEPDWDPGGSRLDANATLWPPLTAPGPGPPGPASGSLRPLCSPSLTSLCPPPSSFWALFCHGWD